jgi:hypothetical protein
MKQVWFGLVLAVLSLFTPPAAAQQVYQSESKSWKFTCPPGWQQIAFDIIKHREKAEREQWSDKVFTYIAGFTRGGMNTFTYPYILINRTDLDLTECTYEEIEEGTNLPEEVSRLRDFELGMYMQQAFARNGTLDRSRGLLTTWGEETDDNGKEYRVTFYTYLGARQSIQFECYDLKSNGSRNDGYFKEFVNSFEMRDDLKFVPTTGISKFDKSNFKEERRSRSSGRSGRGFRIYGIGGLGTLIAAAIVWLIFRD